MSIKDDAIPTEILDKMCQLRDDYTVEFGDLVAKYVQQVPEEYTRYFLAMLEDNSSVHGSLRLYFDFGDMKIKVKPK